VGGPPPPLRPPTLLSAASAAAAGPEGDIPGDGPGALAVAPAATQVASAVSPLPLPAAVIAPAPDEKPASDEGDRQLRPRFGPPGGGIDKAQRARMDEAAKKLRCAAVGAP
jgi:hypothetical protein